MFENTPGFEKIGQDIFVYKDFLSFSELNTISKVIDNLTEDDWIGDKNLSKSHPMYNKISIPSESLNFVRKRIISFLPEGYFLGQGTSFVRLFQNDNMGLHSDAHDFLPIREKAAKLKDEDPFEWADNERWGLVVYFNNFEGGELYYPEQNIIYKPNPGNLVIHSAEDHCLHGVRPVKSKIRYSHSNHIFDKIKIPIV
jgi:hypothetical protein